MVEHAQLAQERSRARRADLLKAAISLFAEGGSRAITYRGVATRAGLPSATTTYYFSSIDQLIQESLADHIQTWTSELEALTRVDFAAAISLEEASSLIESMFSARGPDLAALELSIYLAAAREPDLRDIASRALQALEALAQRVLERIGVTDPEQLAGSVVALIAGTALRRQSAATNEAAEARLLTTAIRQILAAHVMGPSGVDDALATLQPPR